MKVHMYRDSSIDRYMNLFDTKINKVYDLPDKYYTIHFEGNGNSSGTMSDMEGVKYGDKIILNQNTFSKTGYIFKGWSTEQIGTVKYVDREEVRNLCKRNGDSITLYAQWEKHNNHEWDSGQIISDATCKEQGEKVITCNVCHETKRVMIPKISSHNYVETFIPATLSSDGKIINTCSVCGKTEMSQISKVDSITLAKTKYTYNGKKHTPSVCVKDSTGAVIAPSNYKITYSKDCKNVGFKTAKVTFSGKYSGSKSLQYTIIPVNTKSFNVKAGKKQITVNWKKQASQTSGYIIKYSTYINFKSAKTVDISNNKVVKRTIKSLKKGKTYYIRMCTYKKVGNKKICSEWSKAKSVKVKK